MARLVLIAVFALSLGLFSRISFVRLVDLSIGSKKTLGLVFVGSWDKGNAIVFQYPDFSGTYLLGEVLEDRENRSNRQIAVRVFSQQDLGENAVVKLNTDLVLGRLFWSRLGLDLNTKLKQAPEGSKADL